jgi:hypothetical protein
MRSRLAIPLAAAASITLTAASASAIPVDVTDGTLRPILVELETSSCSGAAGLIDPVGERASCLTAASDPAAVFGASVVGSFEVLAGVATVTIAGPDWEAIVASSQGISTGPTVPGVIPGTVSAAVLTFDAATGAPLSFGWTATLKIPVLLIDIPISGVLAAAPNDVYFATFFGNDLALNCVTGAGPTAPAPVAPQCTGTPVSHDPYDPLTGTITALAGVVNGIAREAWAPADFRLSALPEPGSLWLVASAALGLALLRRR